MGDMGEIGAYVYAGSFGDGPDNVIATSNRPEWTLCAFVDGQMASMFSTIPFTVRVLGNAVPMGGVSSVGTLPEFRRRGLARSLMTLALSDMRERGQPIASLWASQAAIYQRYQFTMTTVQRSYSVDTVDIGFYDGDMGSCEVTRVGVSEGYDIIKPLYIEYIKDRICYLHRAKTLWQFNALEERSEDGPTQIAVCRDGRGAPVGYIIYTVRSGRTGHRSRDQEMTVRDFVWLTHDCYRSLWRFIASHDLVGTVRWQSAPLDDPAPELFIEPRQLHTRDQEGAWFRVVDVPAALAARGYMGSGTIKIGIDEDPLAPWNTGTHELTASTEGAEVKSLDGTPDIQLSAKALASLYTGFHSAGVLAGWGLLKGEPSSIQLAERIFATPHAPHCPDHF
jgi:predicted acetyltransferase